MYTLRLFHPNNPDTWKTGRTNVSFAVANGTLSEQDLEWVVEEVGHRTVCYAFPSWIDDSGVVRAGVDGIVDLFHTGDTFNDLYHHHIDPAKRTFETEKASLFNGFDLIASALTLGAYPIIRNRQPSVQDNARRRLQMEQLRLGIRAENLRELGSVTRSPENYLYAAYGS